MLRLREQGERHVALCYVPQLTSGLAAPREARGGVSALADVEQLEVQCGPRVKLCAPALHVVVAGSSKSIGFVDNLRSATVVLRKI